MTTKVRSELVQVNDYKTLQSMSESIVFATDYGATVAGAAAANTTAINAAIVAAAAESGFVIIPSDIAYTESSLVIPDDVVLFVFSALGTMTILSKAQGTVLPVTKGGLVLKAQSNTGVLLRAVDYGTTAEPIFQVLDSVNGNLAAAELKFAEFTEITDPTSAASNKARLYCKDDGSGNTQVAVRFATGSAINLVSQGQQSNLVGTVVWDAASIATAGRATTTLTVTGAALGDMVLTSCGISLAGLVLHGYVSAADTVTLSLYNNTGSPVDLGSATYKALILRNW